MIQGMLTDTVSWEAKTASDPQGWEGDTFADPVNIPAFRAEKTREVVGPGGLEIHSISQIVVVEDVRVGDMIDGTIIQGRSTIRGLGTDTLGYVLTTE